ncbi:hypothetical protein [Paenibacillus sp. GbtcB18]|uniref:hypothetical protein n=1 Tax=Paenibacillus sp. GbtcB18 TaxID=2824763 RepID=UPI001C2F8EEE|nr:hypothetical protein [Paenibacillus sp. GbtcB18]
MHASARNRTRGAGRVNVGTAVKTQAQLQSVEPIKAPSPAHQIVFGAEKAC